MTWLRLLLLLALVSPPAKAESLGVERIWTGKNGKTFRGTLVEKLEGGKLLQFSDTHGKLLQIASANLSEADLRFIESVGKSPETPPQAGDPGAFKVLPVLDRTKLPIINQGDLGQKSNDCVPSSFCNFLLWWDQEKLLEIPKRGDFEAKAEWIHSKMARYCGTRNTAGTSADDARKGFTKYFEEELGDLATLRYHEDHDLRPENLSRYVSGVDAAMLEITTLQANGSTGGHWVSLVSLEPDGRVVFNTWGARFNGRIKVLKASDAKISINGKAVPATTYEIEISNRGDLPEWVNVSQIRFILDPEKWDGIILVRPYLFAGKGKKSAVPADPLFDAPVP